MTGATAIEVEDPRTPAAIRWNRGALDLLCNTRTFHWGRATLHSSHKCVPPVVRRYARVGRHRLPAGRIMHHEQCSGVPVLEKLNFEEMVEKFYGQVADTLYKCIIKQVES